MGVVACITRAGIPLHDDGPSCSEDNRISLNTTDWDGQYIYFPYPEPGNWFIAMQSFCFDETGFVCLYSGARNFQCCFLVGNLCGFQEMLSRIFLTTTSSQIHDERIRPTTFACRMQATLSNC